jgi:hypothetical protein
MIDKSWKEFSEDWADESDEGADDKTRTEYVQEALDIGKLVGDQFKYTFSVEK